MLKILVTGGNGQLAQCFKKLMPLYPQFEWVFKTSKELDITNFDEVEEVLLEERPQFIINAAAYTAVDSAEQESEKAFAVNRDGVANLAEVSQIIGAILIHISTDYVFDGNTNISYSEDNFTRPMGVYGASKRAGEEAALELNPQTIIIRTSWLYSEFKKNFVKTMLHLFSTKKELNIVSDQYGQPTNANDLAEAVMTIINTPYKTFGIYHFSNYPETTWYHFAEKIKTLSGAEIKLNPIPTSDYPTQAQRPMRSTLCLNKIEEDYGIESKFWEHSLEQCIKTLNDE